MNKLLLGCFGDDFTGASDTAAFIKKAGIKLILINGIPKDAEAVIIALKTRTEKVNETVNDSIIAYKLY